MKLFNLFINNAHFIQRDVLCLYYSPYITCMCFVYLFIGTSIINNNFIIILLYCLPPLNNNMPTRYIRICLEINCISNVK